MLPIKHQETKSSANILFKFLVNIFSYVLSYFAKEPAMTSKNKKRELSPSIYFSLNRVIGLKVEKIGPKRSKK